MATRFWGGMRDSSTRSGNACPSCGGSDVMRLPDPGGQSMTSNWQIAATPLGQLSCLRCGLAFRDPALPPATEFGAGYRLYGHTPGGAAEQERQSVYAAWIAAAVPAAARVLDIGCGNGSLLLALGKLWPSAELTGCDP